MRTVRGDIQKVNQDTADGMRNLIELDLVKNRIQSASKALQEADNWVTLSAQIEDTFNSKDTVQVGNQSPTSKVLEVEVYLFYCFYPTYLDSN